MAHLRIILALIVLALWSRAAPADERYYVMIFGSQRVPPNPNHAHTFAVFIRANDCEGERTIHHHVISWLPVDGIVRVQKLFAEAGRNFDLHETMRWAYGSGQRVSVWGPFEIKKILYRRSVRQRKWLNSGFVRYKAVDSLRLDFRVTNCIHAVSTLAGLRRLWAASPSWGETASFYVTLRYHLWIKRPWQTHDWLFAALDLDQYPLIFRRTRPPRSGLIWTRIKRRLGIPIDIVTGTRTPHQF